MKVVHLIFLCFIWGEAYTQTVVQNNLLNKFVGTWRWTSGTDTVEIVLEKQVYIIPMTGSHTEKLVGWHKYVKNGIINQSSYQCIG